MSDLGDTWRRSAAPHLGLRRLLTVVLALLALLGIILGGTLIQPEAATVPPPRAAPVGRTSSICTVSTPAEDEAPAEQSPAFSTGVAVSPASPGASGPVGSVPAPVSDGEFADSRQFSICLARNRLPRSCGESWSAFSQRWAASHWPSCS